ncbi:hypothetical protein [Puniceibacterium confluentis]|uniref:hypothetical protein n=1 Tax=Puniceibacterium confluentis TaxID=1958944 RepID=UPI0011B65363|nr:hypothetical protein [Puniceibacterium confluentis]
MTPEDLLALLAPVRIPAGFAAFGWRDALLFAALGIATALLLAPVLRLFSARRPSKRQQAATEVARLRQLDPEARMVGLARMLRRLDPAAAARAFPDDSLYNPQIPADFGPMEHAVLAAARVRRTQ